MLLGCLVVLALLALFCLLLFGPLFLYLASAGQGGSPTETVFELLHLLQAWTRAPATRLYLAATMLVVTVVLFRLLVRWAVAPQVAVLEGGNPDSVLWRSQRLVRGAWWRTLGVLLVLMLAQSLLTNLFVGMTSLLARPVLPIRETSVVLSVFANLLFLPLPALGTTLLYLDLRTREGARSGHQASSRAD
jgi:hypothetical protein